MAGFKVKLDHRGMRELLTSRGVQNDLDERAERVAEVARSLAPVDKGDYRNSIESVPDPTPRRARAKVQATDWKAHILEAEHRVLGRALDAAGD
jgi:hypothetical protein